MTNERNAAALTVLLLLTLKLPLIISLTLQLSIWDLRQAERGGCVQRMLGAFSGECLNAVACSTEGLVAIGGAERLVLVMDPLK